VFVCGFWEIKCSAKIRNPEKKFRRCWRYGTQVSKFAAAALRRRLHLRANSAAEREAVPRRAVSCRLAEFRHDIKKN
jgi:hypothetical protein